MVLNILAFLYGIIISIIDYIYDSNILLDYKTISEGLFIGMTLFFFLSNRYISFFGSGLFVVGGIVGILLVPHAVDAFIWKSAIYLSIPFLLYHLITIRSLIDQVPQEEIYQFLFQVLPIVVGALLLTLVEDYFVPEEYGDKKLYDKAFQCVVMTVFLYMLNYSSYFEHMTDTNKLILNISALVWLGTVVSGVYILSNFSTFLESSIEPSIDPSKNPSKNPSKEHTILS